MRGTRRDSAVSPNEDLGISNFLPALWIRAISSDRDLKIAKSVIGAGLAPRQDPRTE